MTLALLNGETIVTPILWGIGGLFGILILLGFLRAFFIICPPNRVDIISGFGRRGGYTPVFGGFRFRFPFLQRVDDMSLSLMEVPIAVRNAYSKGGIAMNVDAIANVKISSNRAIVGNAIERFLGQDVQDIRRIAKETLEGQLRGVVANLTPEEVNEDRLAFAEKLTSETAGDLTKLGLHLDTLKILHVNDEVGYLDAIGRKAIANIVRAAEIAESDAQRDAERSESENTGRSSVTRAEADAKIARLRNSLRQVQAELSSEVKSEDERTSAAAREARARAEQRLQLVRADLETIRLQADAVLPAEADRQAKEFLARGEAALISERGRAVAEALELLYAAWQKAGPTAKQIALIEELESILEAAARGVRKISIDSISVIDSGDGETLPNYIGAYPEMLNKVFEAVDKTVGLNITDSISGRDTKEKEPESSGPKALEAKEEQS